MANDQAEIELKVDNWAKMVIQNWEIRMQILGIKNRGLLIRSLKHSVYWGLPNKDGYKYLNQIQFEFLAYGRFVDYGIGRGTNLQRRFERGSDPKNNPRKRMKWINYDWEHYRKLLTVAARQHIKMFIKNKLRDEFSTAKKDKISIG